LIAGLPQSTCLGPRYLFFIGLINDLKTCLPLHKFIDDVTVAKIVGKQTANYSVMRATCDEVENWSKQMIMGSQADKLSTSLTTSDLNIELVNQFKVIGVLVTVYPALGLVRDQM
jgi:hypothetical protein